MPDNEVKIVIAASAKELVRATREAVAGLKPFRQVLDAVADIEVDPKKAESAFEALARSGKLSAEALDASLRAMNSVLAESDRMLLAGATPAQVRQRAYQAAAQVAIGYAGAEQAVAAAAQTEQASLAGGAGVTEAKAQADRAAAQASQEHERALVGVAAASSQTEQKTRDLTEQMAKLGLATQYMQQLGQSAQRAGESLEEAARAKDIRASFYSLAESSGVAADRLIANMKRAARGTVDEIDLMRSANRALLAGGAPLADELPRLFEIARAAAKATGQDVGYVFETLTKGIIKASPLLIDNAEVYIKIGGAVDEYAASLGKATDDLTMAERQHAVLNAVLQQGGEFIAKAGAEAESAADKYDRSRVAVQDFKRDVLGLVDSLGPVGPALLLAGQAATTLAPLLTALILAKQALAKASLQSAAAQAQETAAMSAQAAAAKGAGAISPLGAAGLAVGSLIAVGAASKKFSDDYEKGMKKAGDAWMTFLDGQAKGAASAVEAVEAYRRKQEQVDRTLHESSNPLEKLAKSYVRAREGSKLMRADVEDLHDTLVRASGNYDDYVAAVGRFNSELAKGEPAIRLVSQATYEFRQKVLAGTATLSDLADLMEGRSIPLLGDFAGALRRLEEKAQAAAEAEQLRKERTLEATEITSLASAALGELGLAGEKLAEVERELALALGQTSKAELAAGDQVQLLTQAYALGIVPLEEYTRAMEAARNGLLALTEANQAEIQAAVDGARRKREIAEEEARIREKARRESRRIADERIEALQAVLDAEANVNGEVEAEAEEHQDRMAEIAERGVQERAKANDKLGDALAKAAVQRNRAIEDAERAHRQRVEDIEQVYRRRLQEIERNYARTIREAAVERDALAILQARERRDEELEDARQNRQDALDDEDRALTERLRQAEQAYRDQVDAAKNAYRQQLGELDERIRQEREKEAQAWQQRRQEIQAQTQEEILLARAKYDALLAEHARFLRILGENPPPGWRPNYTLPSGPGGDQSPVAMQRGGSGVVRGPATFRVEPGVREAFWFSGDLRGGQRPQVPFLGGGAAQQTTVPYRHQVDVGGRLSVDVAGLGERIAGRLKGMVTDAVMDEVAGVFEEAVGR